MNNPPARCLDVTRLVSRQGRTVFTGIDRVELAYLKHFIEEDVPCYLFLKTWTGYLLVGPDQSRNAAAQLAGAEYWGRDSILGVMRRRAHPLKRRAEATMRRQSLARCLRNDVSKMLARHVPQGTTYFNVGHSNLDENVMAAWQSVGDVSVLVHDTIPLDFPEYQRAGTVSRFEEKLHAVLGSTKRVICISRETEKAVRLWARNWSLPQPASVVAPIGVTSPTVDFGELSESLRALKSPYFVALGTIEPRKNHSFLLDIWAQLIRELKVADIPRLVIAGARGWENSQVFNRLDGSPMMGRQVFEVNDLGDGARGALLTGSSGLLFPTFAEGFGLPPMEALALNVPVICSDLPVLRENLADFPIYAPVNDMYLWKQSILQLAGQNLGQTGNGKGSEKFAPPTWADHFNTVLKSA